MKEKFVIQNNQYEYPYHHIAKIYSSGDASLVRRLAWGYEYLCYQNHLIQTILDINPKSILEIGCGDGYLLNNLKIENCYRKGVDLSSESIKFANAFSNDNVLFECIDAKEIREEFDLVIASEVLEHIPDIEIPNFIATMVDKCSLNGNIIITVPTIILPLNKKHYRHYTLNLLRQQIESANVGVDIVKVEYIYSNDFVLKNYIKFFFNNKWTIEINFLRKLIWTRVWEKLRFSNERKGHHLVVTLTKSF
jgi:2-polyprenyl-3-methyl-5-hydroxy-6-metoxy-1,4-benzoquinol methylase